MIALKRRREKNEQKSTLINVHLKDIEIFTQSL